MFDIISHHHWHEKPNKHVRSTKLHTSVRSDVGSNIPNSLCRSFIELCKVCQKIYKPRNQKICSATTNTYQTSGEVAFTAIKQIDPHDINEESKDSYRIKYVIICLFVDHDYFEICQHDSYWCHELMEILFRWFNTIGFPSCIRYCVDSEYPISFKKQLMDKN